MNGFFLFLLSFSFYANIPESTENTDHLLPYLEKPYTYLGEGSQVIAFQSFDETYVLKIFKAKHKKKFKFSRFLRHLRGKDTQLSKRKWKEKFQQTTRRYALAYQDLKEETALLSLHFEKTSQPLVATLNGKPIDLSSYPFILQKKATLTKEYLKQFPERKEEARTALQTFFRNRLEKGYSDPRQSFSINYGFIEHTPIQIDVGKIEPFEGDLNQELDTIYKRIDLFLETTL